MGPEGTLQQRPEGLEGVALGCGAALDALILFVVLRILLSPTGATVVKVFFWFKETETL